MKKYSSNMLAYLNEQTSALASDEAEVEYNIQLIDVRNIITNNRNFYGIRDIEGLAQRIEKSNHITPLEVVPIAGTDNYRLISGERRRSAILLLNKSSRRANYKAPCIIQEPFQQQGELTPEMQELVHIIAENDYRTKTILEKYQEAVLLEPVARIFFEKEAVAGISFRTFMAEKFLGISSSALQRIMSVEKLTDDVVQALKDGLLKDSVCSQLATINETDQNTFVKALREGRIKGTVADITVFKQELSNADGSVLSNDAENKLNKILAEEKIKPPVKPLFDDTAADIDDIDEADNYEPPAVTPVVQPVNSKPLPKAHTVDWRSGEKEADTWIINKLGEIFNEAEIYVRSSERNGLETAKWELCQARIKWIIEKMKADAE